ncbi:histidine kinase OS=Streptomyces antimycoticus OX=68175 GN=SSPO_052770 PE=4 SV=1 [Streptomyces antimycoticus]
MHAVVAAHDGQVTVDSVPGRTVFGVHLPHAHPSTRPSTRPFTGALGEPFTRP